MARKRTSPLEDMVLVVSKLPWWAGLSLALVSFVVLHTMAAAPAVQVTGPGQMGSAVSRAMITTLAMFGQYVLPFGFTIAALLSFVNATRQKKLYATTAARSGVASLLDMTWQDFERLVGEHYRRQGFRVERTGGSGPDGGVDLVLKRGVETCLVQCKQWRAVKVGVQQVREFFGVMTARGAAAGYFVTAGEYTADAREFARGRGIELVDGRQLRQMLDAARSPDAAAAPTTAPSATQAAPAAPAPATQPACPKCGAAMTRRIARQGGNAGQPFWGCTTFPRCQGTRPWSEPAAPPVSPQVAAQPLEAPVVAPPSARATATPPQTRPCPVCSEEMLLRQHATGPRAGQYFHGCTTCRKGWPVAQSG